MCFLGKTGNANKQTKQVNTKSSKPKIINQEKICMGFKGEEVLDSMSCCTCGRHEIGTWADSPESLHVL